MTSQEMKKTLWEAADKLRAQMDAAEYKHLVLGLIFLKYVSDAFEERRREVAKLLADPASELYFSDDAGGAGQGAGGSRLLRLGKCLLGATGGAVGDAAQSGQAAGDWPPAR